MKIFSISSFCPGTNQSGPLRTHETVPNLHSKVRSSLIGSPKSKPEDRDQKETSEIDRRHLADLNLKHPGHSQPPISILRQSLDKAVETTAMSARSGTSYKIPIRETDQERNVHEDKRENRSTETSNSAFSRSQVNKLNLLFEIFI